MYEHFKGQSLPWKFAVVVPSFSFVVATFVAWRKQYLGWIEERQYRSRVTHEFATLRHSAQNRYYEWWEACSNPVANVRAKQAAEDMRLQIFEKLQKRSASPLAQAERR